MIFTIPSPDIRMHRQLYLRLDDDVPVNTGFYQPHTALLTLSAHDENTQIELDLLGIGVALHLLSEQAWMGRGHTLLRVNNPGEVDVGFPEGCGHLYDRLVRLLKRLSKHFEPLVPDQCPHHEPLH